MEGIRSNEAWFESMTHKLWRAFQAKDMSASRKTWTDYKVLLRVHNLVGVQDMQRNSRKKRLGKYLIKQPRA